MTTISTHIQDITIEVRQNNFVNINDPESVAAAVEPILQLDELTQRRLFGIIRSTTGVDIELLHSQNENLKNKMLLFNNTKIKSHFSEIKNRKSINQNYEIPKNEISNIENQKSKSEINQNKMRDLQKGYMNLLSNSIV